MLKHGNDAAVVNLMGKNITGRMQANIFTNHPESGAFLDSCHHHCGAWNTIRIDGDLVSVAMQKWYEGIGKPGSKKVRASACGAADHVIVPASQPASREEPAFLNRTGCD
eukprot:COSAG06_NODE_131_length_22532_cov_12.428387_17_plen_110_part_00